MFVRVLIGLDRNVTLLCLLLLTNACAGGCGGTSTPEDAGLPAEVLGAGKGGTTGEVLISVPVQPSMAEQVVRVDGGPGVTIPGGLLTAPATVTLAKLEGAEPGLPKYQELHSAWSVVVGDLHEFARPLTLELPYDRSRLPADAGVPPEVLLSPAYWDEVQREWVALPYTVDAARGVVRAQTRHLTPVAVRGVKGAATLGPPVTIGDLEVRESGTMTLVFEKAGRFVFQFDRAEVEANTGPNAGWYVRDDPTMPPLGNFPPYVKDGIRYFLMAAQAFGAAAPPFAQPSRQWVYFTTAESSSRGKLSGDITLRYVREPNELKLEAAHEYFHSVQNQYFTFPGMSRRKWWIEATADYAGDVVAWGGLGFMGGANYRNPRYLERPLTWASPDISVRLLMQALTDTFIRDGLLKNDPHLDHQYTTAFFIDYLVRNRGVSFGALWAHVATQGADVRAALDGYLNTTLRVSLAAVHRDFARHWAFSPQSPVRAVLKKDVHAVLESSLSRRLEPTDGPVTITVPLEGEHTAKVVELTGSVGSPARALQVAAAALPADVTVDVYLSTQAEQFTLVGSLETGRLSQVAPFDSANTLYLLVVNGSTSAQTVGLTVSPAPLVLGSLSPTAGPVGTVVTLRGSGFGAQQDPRTVTFNRTPATAVTWRSATELVATVPSGATSGDVVVTVGTATSNGLPFVVGALYNIYNCGSQLENATGRSPAGGRIDLQKPAGAFDFTWGGAVYSGGGCPQQLWAYRVTYEGRELFSSGCACGGVQRLTYSGTTNLVTVEVTACSSPAGQWQFKTTCP
jgi:hypothetical protein